MSIQTQIERLTGAKAALKTAIEQKGVAVPEGAPLEQYAPLVEQIVGNGSLTKEWTLLFDKTIEIPELVSSVKEALLTSAEGMTEFWGLATYAKNESLERLASVGCAAGAMNFSYGRFIGPSKTNNVNTVFYCLVIGDKCYLTRTNYDARDLQYNIVNVQGGYVKYLGTDMDHLVLSAMAGTPFAGNITIKLYGR